MEVSINILSDIEIYSVLKYCPLESWIVEYILSAVIKILYLSRYIYFIKTKKNLFYCFELFMINFDN